MAPLAWATALVLIIVVLVLSVAARRRHPAEVLDEWLRPSIAWRTDRLTAMYGKFTAVKDVSVGFRGQHGQRPHRAVGLRQVHLPPHAQPDARAVRGGWITGRVLLDGEDIYAARVSPIQLRRRIGMVFQKPTPFPTMSISTTWRPACGSNGRLPNAELDEIVERSLRRAALWDEVKDRLRTSAIGLSGGQQQRLCLARTIAPEPEVILLDEPTASLDPQGTQRIEELVFELKREFTIVIVTHNMQQAARVSDTTSVLLSRRR